MPAAASRNFSRAIVTALLDGAHTYSERGVMVVVIGGNGGGGGNGNGGGECC